MLIHTHWSMEWTFIHISLKSFFLTIIASCLQSPSETYHHEMDTQTMCSHWPYLSLIYQALHLLIIQWQRKRARHPQKIPTFIWNKAFKSINCLKCSYYTHSLSVSNNRSLCAAHPLSDQTRVRVRIYTSDAWLLSNIILDSSLQ